MSFVRQLDALPIAELLDRSLNASRAVVRESMARAEPSLNDFAHLNAKVGRCSAFYEAAHGGKMDKTDVERAVYDRFQGAFQHPHYKHRGVGGVERWRKNVQFARNTACNTLGLIKTPAEAGRGVWELTDKGRTWVRT